MASDVILSSRGAAEWRQAGHKWCWCLDHVPSCCPLHSDQWYPI